MKRPADSELCAWTKFPKHDTDDESKRNQNAETERYGLNRKDMLRYITAFLQQCEEIEDETLSSILFEFATECRSKKDLLLWLLLVNFTRINGDVLHQAYKIATCPSHKQNDLDFVQFVDYLNVAVPKDRILMDVLTVCARGHFVAPPKILSRETLDKCNPKSHGKFPSYGYGTWNDLVRIKTEEPSAKRDDEREAEYDEAQAEKVFELEQALCMYYGQLEFVTDADLSCPDNLQKVISCILEMQRLHNLCRNTEDVADLGGLATCLWDVIKKKR